MPPESPDVQEPEGGRPRGFGRGLEPDFLWRSYGSAVVLGMVLAGVAYTRWGAPPALGFLAGGALSVASFASITWVVERTFTPGAYRPNRWLVVVALIKYPLLIGALIGIGFGMAGGLLHPLGVATGVLLAPFTLFLHVIGAWLSQHAGTDRR